MTRVELPHVTPAIFQEILDTYPRVLLSGAVRSGKSLLLGETAPGREVFHTDRLRGGVEFVRFGETVRDLLGRVPRFVLAGNVAPQALKSGLMVDAVVWIERSRDPACGVSPNLRRLVEDWEAGHPEAAVYFFERALREEEV